MSKTTIRPLADQLVVKADEKDETTESGIVLPDSVDEEANRGTVIAVGPGRYDERGQRIPMTVQVGDELLFSPAATQIIKVDDEELLMMTEDGVMAIIKEE